MTETKIPDLGCKVNINLEGKIKLLFLTRNPKPNQQHKKRKYVYGYYY